MSELIARLELVLKLRPQDGSVRGLSKVEKLVKYIALLQHYYKLPQCHVADLADNKYCVKLGAPTEEENEQAQGSGLSSEDVAKAIAAWN